MRAQIFLLLHCVNDNYEGSCLYHNTSSQELLRQLQYMNTKILFYCMTFASISILLLDQTIQLLSPHQGLYGYKLAKCNFNKVINSFLGILSGPFKYFVGVKLLTKGFPSTLYLITTTTTSNRSSSLVAFPHASRLRVFPFYGLCLKYVK